MAPTIAVFDVPNVDAGDAKVESDVIQSMTRRKTRTYLSNVVRRQLGRSAEFLGFVLVVVVAGARRQMVGIHTRRVVACVHRMAVGRQRSVGAFIRQSVCAQLLTVVTRDDAVAIFTDGASPRPACVWMCWMKVVEEAFIERTVPCSIATRFRAIGTARTARWAHATEAA